MSKQVTRMFLLGGKYHGEVIDLNVKEVTHQVGYRIVDLDFTRLTQNTPRKYIVAAENVLAGLLIKIDGLCTGKCGHEFEVISNWTKNRRGNISGELRRVKAST